MSTRLVWIDLETTGLTPEDNRILEVASIITDLHLNEIARMEMVVGYSPRIVADLREKADPFVRKMHADNGLWDASAKSPHPIGQVEANLGDFVKQHGGAVAACNHLAGNSIRLDANFLERWMPSILPLMHYRILDVSCFKVAALMYRPELVPEKGNGSMHRAMTDIEWSIKEFRTYKERLFPS